MQRETVMKYTLRQAKTRPSNAHEELGPFSPSPSSVITGKPQSCSGKKRERRKKKKEKTT